MGVTEMVKGNEMVASGLAVVAPCSGLAKSWDPDTALIHASEIDRLGPGPVTLRSIVPMAADWVAVAAPARSCGAGGGGGGAGRGADPVADRRAR